MPAILHLVSRDVRAIRHLLPRDGNDKVPMTPLIMNLLIALVVFLAVGFLSVGVLLLLRSHRNKSKLLKEEEQPQKMSRSSSRISHRRHGANTAPINTTYAASEKEKMLNEKEDMPGTPDSPVPEIRITFPDEVDEKGGRRSPGQVVKVTLSEKGGVGLEPYKEDQLPLYEKNNGRLESLDLDRIGGLKEINLK